MTRENMHACVCVYGYVDECTCLCVSGRVHQYWASMWTISVAIHTAGCGADVLYCMEGFSGHANTGILRVSRAVCGTASVWHLDVHALLGLTKSSVKNI